jgi:four helix bundle protein
MLALELYNYYYRLVMDPASQSVQRFKVWQHSVDLVVLCYRLSGCFPADERFGLVSQVRRAANCSREHRRGILAVGTRGNSFTFSRLTSGSLRELQTHLIVATRLGYLASDSARPALDAIDQTSKMLYRMRQRMLENLCLSAQPSRAGRNLVTPIAKSR